MNGMGNGCIVEWMNEWMDRWNGRMDVWMKFMDG
jgi:hypothetical protein